MTVVNTTTGEVIDRMTEAEARRITERIRSAVVHTRESIEKIQRLLTEARDGHAHVALGYGEAEWTRYMADLFADQPLRLPRDQRQQLVGYLAGEGMSTRAIAPIVGTSHETAAADLRGVRNLTPVDDSLPDGATEEEVTPSARPIASPSDVAEVEEPGEEVEPTSPPAPLRPVTTGIDGKNYPKLEPRTPRRKALTDSFFTAAYDMGKAIEKVARLTEDDRFPQNADQVAAKHRNDLIRSRDLLEQVIESLPKEQHTND